MYQVFAESFFYYFKNWDAVPVPAPQPPYRRESGRVVGGALAEAVDWFSWGICGDTARGRGPVVASDEACCIALGVLHQAAMVAGLVWPDTLP